jgi:hypothetical protein
MASRSAFRLRSIERSYHVGAFDIAGLDFVGDGTGIVLV